MLDNEYFLSFNDLIYLAKLIIMIGLSVIFINKTEIYKITIVFWCIFILVFLKSLLS